MKKFLAAIALSIMFLQISIASAPGKWTKVFDFTSESEMTVSGFAGNYKLFTGTGTELTPENKDLMADPSSNYYILDGKKRLPVKAFFVPLSSNYNKVNYYGGHEGNSDPVYPIEQLEDGKITVSGTKNGKVAVFQQKLDLEELETESNFEFVESLPLGEGEGVQVVYTTDWDDQFYNIETKLVKISTVRDNGDRFGFTYKKNGFTMNNNKCINSKKMPFCFKKDGGRLIVTSRAQLADTVSFWFKK